MTTIPQHLPLKSYFVLDGVIYLTPEQLRDYWICLYSLRTFAKWRLKKFGPPFIRSGKYILYPYEDLKAWEAAHKKP